MISEVVRKKRKLVFCIHLDFLRLENEGSRDDGQKETKLIAEFRNTLRTSLLVGLAKGHAQMLRAAGLPHRAKACRPRAVHYSSQLTMLVVRQMVSRLSVTMTPTA